ncbi:coatomer subunit beta [Serendipita sp. 407]|nr:coatomer subunit beta [Serendipita sp. 407]
MPIIQFVLPSKNKQLKKLLHFYWEVCRKKDDQGKLKQEMILVCNAIRNDLQHPNEYIRGATLRFLQKIKEPELLEPLVPTCRQCLEHRHSYVRKNAVLAILTIYQSFEHLIPDAPELIQNFLTSESDTTCKRNAFVFLINVATPKAVEYTLSVYDQVGIFEELMQLAVIELIRKDCKGESANKPKWIRLVFELLNVSSHAVKYDAATTLTTLTQNPAAVKAAATAFAELVAKESDNNVKLIALDRIETLHSKHEHVLDNLAMDILGVLTSTDMEVRRKAVKISLSMVTSRNVQDVVLFLKKQLTKTLEQEYEKNVEYRQLLIQSIHVCAIRFSEVAASVVHAMMEFLGDSSNSAAVDVIAFVREVVEKFPNLRQSIIEKLLATFPDIKSGKVYRDSQERIMNCIRVLSEMSLNRSVNEVFLLDTKAAYAKMVATEEKKAQEKREKESKVKAVQVDDVFSFRQFSKKGISDATEDYELDVSRATGSNDVVDDIASNLSSVIQLTGFSDPVYAEAYVKVHGFDILLDVLIVNQTTTTMQNLCLEFATLGDLKLVERPSTHTLGPHSFHSVKTSIKVSSTESGVIFGNIIWESGTTETCVVLSDIHIDIMDYIKPATCTETQFRSMWTEFEWENRVNVTTEITQVYLVVLISLS